jgi:hypothetical protein
VDFIGRTHKQLRQTIGAILILPFLLVALLPKGFMPATTGDGWFTVTICTSAGLRTVVLDENGQEVPSNQNEDTPAGNYCVFSFLSSNFVSPDVTTDCLSPARGVLPGPARAQQPVRHKAFIPLGARAPPVLA